MVLHMVLNSPNGTKSPYRHSPFGTTRVKVKDQGEGVLETELNDLFEPFCKGQSGEKTKGYGLGLAIAKQIVDAHVGEMIAKNIHLVSEKPTGLSVEIKLPV